jgi:cytidine deaminase
VLLILPAVQLDPFVVDTPLGRIVAPGQQIPEKRIEVDPEQIQRIVLAARQAAQSAYAPYSRFRVGAAVVMADDPSGTIYLGANVENSSYGATVCAERTGLLHGATLGFRRLRYIAVSTVDALERPLAERSPCGICRQVIKEFTAHAIATDTALILLDSAHKDVLCEVFDIERLLPYGFHFGHSASGGECA